MSLAGLGPAIRVFHVMAGLDPAIRVQPLPLSGIAGSCPAMTDK
jgi:hypothetical protein